MKNRAEIKEIIERIKKAEDLDEIKSIIKEAFPKNQAAPVADGFDGPALTADQLEKVAGGGHYATLADGSKVWIVFLDGDVDYPDNEIYDIALMLEAIADTGCVNRDTLVLLAAEYYGISEYAAGQAFAVGGPAYLANRLYKEGGI